ncbi:GNAT family N-acetyltransferase [Sphingobium nicotianae]|uniref:GNAT family N-acetyltransferase n=1 Tax=Sphingobium nicotianae TaxID=2782607 RepID=A0A9X1AI41_9SPHN|nr:GNAT family N-acetyltransferase [Sphingobium nicotianae]MBT2185512.1 GNAT family N-acetyltransferase [Sphingobium nicotianae]
MTPLSIRLLRADETDLAAAISRRAMRTVPCFDETLHSPQEDRDFWREHIFPTCEIWGAFEKDVLLGQAAVSEGWVHQLHVDPIGQGRGIGSALLAALKIGMPDIQLWTFQANHGARRFYERHGFIAVEQTDGSRNEEREPDVRYRWVR